MKKIILCIIFALCHLPLGATPPPFPGGVLVIYFSSASGECSLNPRIPMTEVEQFYFNGKKMWRIGAEKGVVRPREIDISGVQWVGTESMHFLAEQNLANLRPCVIRVEFDPASGTDRREALARSRVGAGKLKRAGSVWYWTVK